MANKKAQFYNDPSINLVAPEVWDNFSPNVTLLKVSLARHAGVELAEVNIEKPKDFAHGDYATNIALIKANKEGTSPREIATKLAQKLNADPTLQKNFKNITVAGPGFINFELNEAYLLENLTEILTQKEHFGANSILKDKRILLEFAHPNPFKVFHIGHLRNIILGESLVRLLENSGAELIRANYQGDVGMHVAKSIWGMIELIKTEGVDLAKLNEQTTRERVDFLGKSYALGAKAYEEDLSNQEIKDLNHIVYAIAQEIEIEKYDWTPQVKYKDFIKSEKYSFEQIKEYWEIGVKWSLAYLRERIYSRLYTSFEREYMESETQYLSEKNIERAKEAKILVKSEGAYVIDGEKYGTDTRVFINSLGLPTYEGKEMGLAPMEANDFGEVDLFIHNVAVEQVSYFKAVFKVLAELDPELYKGKKYHNAYEFVGLQKGKMSSRTGNVVTAEDILDSANAKILEAMKDRDFDQQALQETSEIISTGAIKYSFLNISPFKYLAFDFEASLNFEGDSGPYLQYTYARANKILATDQMQVALPQTTTLSAEETSLLRWLAQYREVCVEATKTLSPNILCTYLHELAQKFNAFYRNNPILKAENEEIKAQRLAITQASAQIIQNGLNLLGIKTVEKM